MADLKKWAKAKASGKSGGDGKLVKADEANNQATTFRGLVDSADSTDAAEMFAKKAQDAYEEAAKAYDKAGKGDTANFMRMQAKTMQGIAKRSQQSRQVGK